MRWLVLGVGFLALGCAPSEADDAAAGLDGGPDARPDLELDAALDMAPDAALDMAAPDAGQRCNGHAANCDRALPDVVFATTHNAHAAAPVFNRLAANQHIEIAEQLALGVRGLGVKLYWSDDPDCGPEGLYAWHGFARLGCVPFASVAQPIEAFLAASPDEVLVLTIEGSAPAARVQAAMTEAGLDPWVYLGGEDEAWPTLQTLIEADTRLVVFKAGAGGQLGLHEMWDEIQDTPYDFQSVDEMGCGPNRGPESAALFLMNHFLTRLAPVPLEAEQTNAAAMVAPRIRACAELRGLPTLVYVDFVEQGAVLPLVAALGAPGESEARLAAMEAVAESL